MGKKKKENVQVGSLSINDLKKRLNKLNVDVEILNKDSSTVVNEWIPTGSKLLDGSINLGGWGGIPVGKITEIAGLESAGKSYLAALIAAEAQKMNIDVVWFDTEAASDPQFMERLGVNVERLLYIQPKYLEEVYDVIESFADCDNKMLFVLDSMAMLSAKADLENDVIANGMIANKARVNSKLIPRVVTQLNQQQHTFVVVNQLKTNITQNPMMALVEPWMTPGGKSLTYSYSLRIWLTKSKSKKLFVEDSNGYRIGSHVKATIKKSRFGTEGRFCEFKLLWGDPERTGVMDEESWFNFLKNSSSTIFTSPNKGWYCLGEKKFRESEWIEVLKDSALYDLAVRALEEELVTKFKTREAPASQFFDKDEETESKNNEEESN